MKDFEEFLAGRGRMAALVGALPRFEPPAGMEARFLASLPAGPAADGRFEPPASLADAVLAEAARVDAAQATRREAALHEIARSGPAQALGAELGEDAAEWLRHQSEPRARARDLPRRRPAWFAALGGALAASLALGVALQLLREPVPQPAREAYRQVAPATPPSEVLRDQHPARADLPPRAVAPAPVREPGVARLRSERAAEADERSATAPAPGPAAAAPRALAGGASPAAPLSEAKRARSLEVQAETAPQFALPEPPSSAVAGALLAPPAAAAAAAKAIVADAATPAEPLARLRFALSAPAAAMATRLLEARVASVHWRMLANRHDETQARERLRELHAELQRIGAQFEIELILGNTPAGQLEFERVR